MKTEKDIEEMIDRLAYDKRDLRGMTYQEGLRNALDWVLETDGEEDLLE